MGWRVAGYYLEACNCDPVCPCRMVNGVLGSRSTHGICYGVISWRIDQGYFDGAPLDGLAAALVIRYDDDEPGSPWSIVLHIDDRGDDRQRAALGDIFLGRLGGLGIVGLPWVRKPSNLLDVRVSEIELGDGELRIGERLRLRAPLAHPTGDDVRCIVPGYDRPGTELQAIAFVVDDEPFRWELSGSAAFTSDFDYASDEETTPTGQATPVPPSPQ